MRKLKWGLVIFIVLIGATVLTSLWINLKGRKAAEQEEVAPSFSSEDAKMYLEKIHFVEDKKGKKTWELEAKSIQQNREEKIMVLEDVTVTVYTEEGRTFTISGKQGKVSLETKDLDLKGDVVVASSDGYRLRTQSVAYRHQEKKAGTSDPVEIDGEQIHVAGKGMIVNMEDRTFKILGQVKTRLKRGGKV